MKTKPRTVTAVYLGRMCVAVEQPKGSHEWYPIDGAIPTERGVLRQWNLTPPKPPTEGPEQYQVFERAGGVLTCTCSASTRFTRHGRVYLRGSMMLCKHAAAIFDMLEGPNLTTKP